MIQNQEFIQEFVDEAKSHIEKVEAALLQQDALNRDPELINDVFRAVHSIKGTAGFFGLKKIVSLAHAMENVFGEMRGGRLTVTDSMVEVLLGANDCIRELVEDVFASEDKDVSHWESELNRLLETGADEKPGEVLNERMVLISDHQQRFSFEGTICQLLKEGLKHGHSVYEVKLRFVRDLLNYTEGPVKLFNKMDALGMVVESFTDHTAINSLDDVLEAAEQGTKDVHLGIVVTTVLERELFAGALGLPLEKVSVLRVEAGGEADSGAKEESKEDPKATVEEQTARPKETVPATSGAARSAEKPATGPATPKPESGTPHLKLDDSIRVHVSILNDLLDMAGEMVLARNQLLRTLDAYRKTIPGLAPILQNIDRLTTGVQEKIMQTRMQPVGNVFNKFPRIIRDISKSLGKEIELSIEGEDVELDKSIIEALTDPLTHLVRNAADHGIETAEDRQRAGKPRNGKIGLRAFHEGGYVNIDITDDGRGMDVEKIKKVAAGKEIVSPHELERMTEAEILKLIFRPGFSTADKVSDLSGRGVGMDVVKTNIEKLGGSVEIFTTKGQGTTIRLMLPLTLAIIQSLIVEVEGNRFALPQVNLKEIVRIKEGDLAYRIEYLNEAEVLRLRGRLLPIVHLADVLNITRTFVHPVTGERLPDRRKWLGDARRYKNGAPPAPTDDRRGESLKVTRVLVLKIGNRMFGLVVDSIIGREETLVKPLPVYLKDCNCYSGVTILGDGKTAMILDPEGIIRMADLQFREENEGLAADISRESRGAEYQNLLLFKCSGNETLALDLALVARIEEVGADRIETVGDKEFITFNDTSLRVIRPEDYLPISRGNTKPAKYYVIIPKLVTHPIGILIEKIHDNIQTEIHLDSEGIMAEGLIGSAVYNDRIILLLNIYELFQMADPVHYGVERLPEGGSQRILLVEDTPSFQRIGMKYLKEAGYEVTLAQNGKEALDYLASATFDAVISDIHMPVMDGFELIKKIRDNAATRSLPAIALTSISDEQGKRAVIESGFDYYEWKLNRDSLLNTLQQALQRRKGEAS